MAAPIVLGIMMLLDPDQVIDTEAAAAISEDANRVELSAPTTAPAAMPAKKEKEIHVVAEMGDFDRKEGVIEFAGKVVVKYADDYQMSSDELYMFMVGSNEVSRVVAIGNVAITNDNRNGTCEMAVYRRKKGEIEMYGTKNAAELVENGQSTSALRGSCIRFWLESNQVEVENSQIEAEKDKDAKGGIL